VAGAGADAVDVCLLPAQEAMPFSIIGSTDDVKTRDGRVVKGREYLWGVAEGECVARFVTPKAKYH